MAQKTRKMVMTALHAGIIFIIYVLFFAIWGMPCQYALEMVAGAANPLLLEHGAALISSLLVSVIAAWYISLLRRKRKLSVLKYESVSGLEFLSVALLGMGIAIIMSAIITLVSDTFTPATQYVEAVTSDVTVSTTYGILYSVIGAPINEELVFRGIIYGILCVAFSKEVALCVAAILFGILHGQLLWIAYAIVSGIILTLVYERHGSIYASIIFHSAFNLMGTVFLPLLPNVQIALLLAAGLVTVGLVLSKKRNNNRR